VSVTVCCLVNCHRPVRLDSLSFLRLHWAPHSKAACLQEALC